MEIDKKVDKAFELLDKINEVKVSPSFKKSTLDKALRYKEREIEISWFTPKLQLAAMVVVLVVNVSVISYTFWSSPSVTNVGSFAQDYSLTTKIDIPLIN